LAVAAILYMLVHPRTDQIAVVDEDKVRLLCSDLVSASQDQSSKYAMRAYLLAKEIAEIEYQTGKDFCQFDLVTLKTAAYNAAGNREQVEIQQQAIYWELERNGQTAKKLIIWQKKEDKKE
jgi:hypothetical protein